MYCLSKISVIDPVVLLLGGSLSPASSMVLEILRWKLVETTLLKGTAVIYESQMFYLIGEIARSFTDYICA